MPIAKNSTVMKMIGLLSSQIVRRTTPALKAAEEVSTKAKRSLCVAIMSNNFITSLNHGGRTMKMSEPAPSLELGGKNGQFKYQERRGSPCCAGGSPAVVCWGTDWCRHSQAD